MEKKTLKQLYEAPAMEIVEVILSDLSTMSNNRM